MTKRNGYGAIRRKVIIIAVGVLFMAFYLYQVATGYRLPFFSSSAPGSVAEGSMQASVQACKRVVRSEFGESLQQMKVDDRSTRYEEALKSYRVFIDIVIDGAEREDTYVECRISAVSHEVLDYRVNGPVRQFNQIGI